MEAHMPSFFIRDLFILPILLYKHEFHIDKMMSS
jgi:hypothetical protein